MKELERMVDAVRASKIQDPLAKAKIRDTRAAAFRMLAEASAAERELILIRRPGGEIPPAGSEEMGLLADQARMLLADRRLRDRYLPGRFLGEPAWDMLLALFVAAHEDRALSTTEACEAGQTAMTNGLRVLDQLEEARFIVRSDREGDRRRTDIRLAPTGIEKVAVVLSNMGVFARGAVHALTEPAPERDPATGKKVWVAPALSDLDITPEGEPRASENGPDDD